MEREEDSVPENVEDEFQVKILEFIQTAEINSSFYRNRLQN